MDRRSFIAAIIAAAAAACTATGAPQSVYLADYLDVY